MLSAPQEWGRCTSSLWMLQYSCHQLHRQSTCGPQSGMQADVMEGCMPERAAEAVMHALLSTVVGSTSRCLVCPHARQPFSEQVIDSKASWLIYI